MPMMYMWKQPWQYPTCDMPVGSANALFYDIGKSYSRLQQPMANNLPHAVVMHRHLLAWRRTSDSVTSYPGFILRLASKRACMTEAVNNLEHYCMTLLIGVASPLTNPGKNQAAYLTCYTSLYRYLLKLPHIQTQWKPWKPLSMLLNK